MSTTSWPGLALPPLPELSGRDGEKWAVAGPGVLPAWVADMDFPIAPAVRAALVRRIDTDLGYPAWYDESCGGPLGGAFADRMARWGWAVDPAHVRLFTDVNQAIQVALHLGTAPGDAVVAHTPCCPPFLEVLTRMRRPPRTVPMCLVDGRWRFDADRLADEVTGRGGRPPARALLLVNPHNPTGRVFDRAELAELGRLAVERDLLVISDEVHAELTFPPHQHIPFASLGRDVAARTITVTSGSKAFNLAGVRCAVAHVGVAAVRAAIDEHRGVLFGQVGALGVDALLAAWTAADEWLATVRALLARNRDWLLARMPPEVGYRPPEATYLAWLDCRPLGRTDPAAYFLDRAKVLLFRGTEFGSAVDPAGSGFARLNFATSPAVLAAIVERMCAAVERRG